MVVQIEIELVTLALAIFGLFLGILRFYNRLGSKLPAKWMFVVYALSFAACSALQISTLDASQTIQQLANILQGAAFGTFVLALITCALAAIAVFIDALHKYLTRTPFYYQDEYGRITRLN